MSSSVGTWRPSVDRATLGCSALGRSLLGVAACFVLVTAAGCARQAAETESSASDLIVAVEPTALVFDLNDPPNLAGVSTTRSEIEAGECFNEYLYRGQTDFVEEITTIVSCQNPHDREAYFTTEYPGNEADNYPLDDELTRWADSVCLDEFEGFVGLEYVLSQLEIGAFVPTFESWGAGDRNVVCYLYPDQGGRLRDSARSSEL